MKLAVTYRVSDTNYGRVIEDQREVFNFDEDNHAAISIIQSVSDKYEGLGLSIDHEGDEETYVFVLNIPSMNDQFDAQVMSFYNELRNELHKAGF